MSPEHEPTPRWKRWARYLWFTWTGWMLGAATIYYLGPEVLV